MIAHLSTLNEQYGGALSSLSTDEVLLAHLAHGDLDALDLVYGHLVAAPQRLRSTLGTRVPRVRSAGPVPPPQPMEHVG